MLHHNFVEMRYDKMQRKTAFLLGAMTWLNDL